MSPFLFSPIKNRRELLKAIEYVHFSCYKLCKRTFGEYLPVAGNIGVFCHYDSEYEYLTKVREKWTLLNNNINKKYYRLKKPIVIPAKGDVPETTYLHLYIRRPEVDHPDVGDVDFYLEPEKYYALKESLLKGKKLLGVKIFERADLDLIKLFDPDIRAAAFVGTNYYTSKK